MSISQNDAKYDRCLVCNGRARTFLRHHAVGHFLRCQCGLIFQDPREFLEEKVVTSYASDAPSLDPESFKRVFSESIDTSDDNGNMYAEHGIQHEKMVLGICDQLVDVLKKSVNFNFEKPFSMLDIGCATGFLLHSVRRRFPMALVAGVEPSPVSSDKARQLYGLQIHVGTMNSFAAPDSPFDLITILGNLQLHEDPFRTLTQATAMLRPAGVLVCQFKNPYCTTRVLSRFASKLPLLSSSSLTKLLLEKGFACMRHSGSKRALRASIESTGLQVIRTTTLPPRMASYSNMNQAHASGIKGKVWAVLNRLDKTLDQQAWIEFICQKPT